MRPLVPKVYTALETEENLKLDIAQFVQPPAALLSTASHCAELCGHSAYSLPKGAREH